MSVLSSRPHSRSEYINWRQLHQVEKQLIEQNVSVNDLLNKAKRIESLKIELEDIRIFFQYVLSQNERENYYLRDCLDEQRRKNNDLKAILDEKNREINALKDSLNEKRKEIDSLRCDLNRNNKTISKLEDFKELDNVEIEGLKKSLEKEKITHLETQYFCAATQIKLHEERDDHAKTKDELAQTEREKYRLIDRLDENNIELDKRNQIISDLRQDLEDRSDWDSEVLAREKIMSRSLEVSLARETESHEETQRNLVDTEMNLADEKDNHAETKKELDKIVKHFSELLKKKYKTADVHTCRFCLENNASSFCLLPCGHLSSMCDECFVRVAGTSCPDCRSEIECFKKFNIYNCCKCGEMAHKMIANKNEKCTCICLCEICFDKEVLEICPKCNVSFTGKIIVYLTESQESKSKMKSD